MKRAIFAAVSRLVKEARFIEIMIPLVGIPAELEMMRALVVRVVDNESDGIKLDYKAGTMIELPRACLVADRIAEQSISSLHQ